MTKPLWQQRNFMLLWSGQLVSWVGSRVSGIALPLVVLALTNSPVQAGGVAGIRGLVFIILAIPAGVLMDRWNRRTVMVLANLGSGIAIGSIAVALFFHQLTVLQVYIASVADGIFFVFANLGRLISFPKVVSKEQYPAASAQSAASDNFASLIGPPLGGFLYQTIGAFMSFFIDSFSYFLNAISVFFINIPLGTETPIERKAIRHDIKEAFVLFWRQPLLQFITLLTAGRRIIESGSYLLIIVLAKEHHASSLFIGSIFAVGAIGGILGSLGAAKIHNNFKMRPLLMNASFLSFFIFSLYAVAINNYLLAAVTAMLYAIEPLFEVIASTYTIKVIPDALRGRILSLNRPIIYGAYSLGFFIAGILLQYLGGNWTIGLFSCLLFILFLATLLNKKLVAT